MNRLTSGIRKNVINSVINDATTISIVNNIFFTVPPLSYCWLILRQLYLSLSSCPSYLRGEIIFVSLAIFHLTALKLRTYIAFSRLASL